MSAPTAGEWIAQLREHLHLSQEKLAALLFADRPDERVNKGMVSKWESGDDTPKWPSAWKLLLLARQYGFSANETGNGHKRPLVDSRPDMQPANPFEERLIFRFRQLDPERQTHYLNEIVKEAEKLSQTPAARKKG